MFTVWKVSARNRWQGFKVLVLMPSTDASSVWRSMRHDWVFLFLIMLYLVLKEWQSRSLSLGTLWVSVRMNPPIKWKTRFNHCSSPCMLWPSLCRLMHVQSHWITVFTYISLSKIWKLHNQSYWSIQFTQVRCGNLKFGENMKQFLFLFWHYRLTFKWELCIMMYQKKSFHQSSFLLI